ncbi:MAG: ABC transporter ATP-binding protein, partial [Pseudomonadota bacterium]
MKDFRNTLEVFFRLLREYPGRSAVVSLLLLFAGVAEGLGLGSLPVLFKLVLGNGGSGDTRLGRWVEQAYTAIGISPSMTSMMAVLAGLIAFKGLLILLAMRQVGYTAASVEADIRVSLIRGLMGARWRHFIEQAPGKFAAAITIEAYYASYCYELVCRFIAEALQLAIYAGVALLVSWQLTIGGLFGGCLSIMVLSRFIGMARRAGDRQTKLLEEISVRLVDGLQGMKALKAMSCEDRLGPLLEREIRGLAEARRRQVLSSGGVRALYDPVFVVVLGGGGYIAFSFLNTDIEAFLLLMVIFWRALARLGAMQFTYQEVARYESFLSSLRGSIDEAEAARETWGGDEVPDLDRYIELRNVDFSFGDKVVLDNASMTAPVGCLTVICGPSGAGKTTVADLILGLLRPGAGDLFIGETPLSRVDIKAWRSMIGYVPQDAVLFHDSLLTNVTLGDKDLSREDAESALRLAGAAEFTADLEQGIMTDVGERGGKLSGGQRQRVALARALVRRPKLLILDEATSALDPRTEAEINAELRRLARYMTIIAVSHKESLIAVADVAYEVKDGRIQVLR